MCIIDDVVSSSSLYTSTEYFLLVQGEGVKNIVGINRKGSDYTDDKVTATRCNNLQPVYMF